MDSDPDLTEEDLDSRRVKKIKLTNLPSEDNEGDTEQFPLSSADKLLEDELSIILSNASISTRDLFNFRLVNKSWCDAATSNLLRRDTSHITLGARRYPQKDAKIDHHFTNSEYNALFCKFGIQTKTTNNLKKLITLMSNSIKFPSSNIRLYIPSWAFGRYSNCPDLMLFFELHGDKIKSLSIHGCLPSELSINVLLQLTPHLKCLNLSTESLLRRLDRKDDDMIALKNLPIQSVFLFTQPFTDDIDIHNQVLHQLLSFPPRLNSLENVTVNTFLSVLEEGKGHMIQSLVLKFKEYEYELGEYLFGVEQLAGLNLKLSKLTLDLTNTDFYSGAYSSILQILKSSNDTLKALDIHAGEIPDNGIKLKIPPMKNLKSVKIRGSTSYDEDIPGNNSFWELEKNVEADKYFPNLVKVSMKLDCLLDDQNVLLSLFQFKQRVQNERRRGARARARQVWSPLPKVETLTIKSYECPGIENAKWFRQVFPNIRILKAAWNWGYVAFFKSSFWTMCPLAEVIEITGISTERMTNDLVSVVDSFFTGFSLGLCKKLRQKQFPLHMDNPETWQFLRTEPSICDLQHLKEFKLQFKELPRIEFASSMIGEYAFSQMPNTKFIITYDPHTTPLRPAVLFGSEQDDDDENSDDENVDTDNETENNENDSDEIGDDRSSKSCGSENGDDQHRSDPSCSSESENDENCSRNGSSDSDRDVDDEELCFAFIKPYAQIFKEIKTSGQYMIE